MAETKVSKKTATNQKTGRLKKGYKAKGKGVYVKVSTAKKKAVKRKVKRKAKVKISITKKIKALLK
jgi:hypothetical protein